MKGLSSEMLRVLRIAERDGAVSAGTGAYAGHVERVNAATVMSLLRRGLLLHTYGSEGHVGGRLTPAGRAALTQDPAQSHVREEMPVSQPRAVKQDFIEAWMSRLAEAAQDLDFKDPDDRATFRGQVRAAMRNLKWSGMRDLASYLGGGKSGSRDAALNLITTLYMQRTSTVEKKTAAQLDAEIAQALAKGKP